MSGSVPSPNALFQQQKQLQAVGSSSATSVGSTMRSPAPLPNQQPFSGMYGGSSSSSSSSVSGGQTAPTYPSPSQLSKPAFSSSSSARTVPIGGSIRSHDIFDAIGSCARIFPFGIQGSLSQMRANEENSISRNVTTDWNVRYRKHDTDINGIRVGNARKAFLIYGTIEGAYNNYPFSLLCQAPKPAWVRGNVYCGTKRGFFAIAPNVSQHFENGIPVLLTDKSLFSDLVALYGGHNHDQLEKATAVESTIFVDETHPVLHLMKNNEYVPDKDGTLKMQYDMSTFQRVGNKIGIPEDLYTPMIGAYRTQIIPRLPFFDMLNLSVKFTPLFEESWDEAVEKYVGQQDPESLSNYYGAAGIFFRLVYRLVPSSE